MDPQKPAKTVRTPRRSTFTRPRRQVPPVPQTAASLGIQASDIPDHLVPQVPPVSELVHVGTVFGYEVHAPRKAIERAEQLRRNLPEKEGKQWPSDVLLSTILALKMGGKMTMREIGVALNMSERHVRRMLAKGKRESNVERELERLDNEGLPMAVENVLEGLEAKDKDYTHEFLKGRGIYGKKVEQTNVGTPMVAGFVVRFEHTGTTVGEARAGAIAASPNLKVIDGEVQTS